MSLFEFLKSNYDAKRKLIEQILTLGNINTVEEKKNGT